MEEWSNLEERIDRLTDKQSEVLQLVVQRKSSKEISRILGISKPAVDQRIASARKVLDAQNRDEAALMFATTLQTYDPIIYDPACVPNSKNDVSYPNPDRQEEAPLVFEEAPISFGDIETSNPSSSLLVNMGSLGELNTVARIAAMVAMTVGILMIALVGLSVSQSLSELLS